MPAADVRHDRDRSRFEIYVDDVLAGHLDYRLDGTMYALDSTDVFPEFGGHGVGSSLVVSVLETIRAAGGQVLPFCPFIPRVIADNPEFAELVPAESRARFGIA